MDGVRVALKDMILAWGWPTLRGSRAVDPNQDWNGGFAGNRATARTWHRSSREDDDIGIRLEGAWRQSSDRDHSQSMECGAHAGRKQRRFGSRRGVRVRFASCCDGWWRLDAASGGAQRCFRVQADIRQGAGLSALTERYAVSCDASHTVGTRSSLRVLKAGFAGNDHPSD